MDLATLEAKYGALSGPKEKKKRSGWAKWLPTALGVVGSLAAAPFTGGTSLLGTAALLGGGAALGSGVGEFAAQKLNKEKTDVGNILQEAGVSGLTSAIPIGGAAKAARVSKMAAKEGIEQIGKEGVEEVAETGSKSLLGRISRNMRASSSGVVPGATVEGTSKRLRPAAATKLNQYLDDVSAKGSVANKMTAVERDLADTGKSIGDLVQNGNRLLTIDDIEKVTKAAGTRQKGVLGMTAKDPIVEDVKTQIASGLDLTEAKSLRDSIDEQLRSFYSKGERATTTTAAAERVLKGYRDGLDKVLSDAVPGFRVANTRYATGLKAQQVLSKTADKAASLPFGLKSRTVEKARQAGQDMAARSVGKIGDLRGSLPGKAAEEALKLTVGRSVAEGFAPVPDEQTFEGSTQIGPTIDGGASDAMTDMSEEDKINTGLKKAALQALAAGDSKGLDSIMKVAQFFQSQSKPSSKMSDTAIKNVNDIEKALSSLDVLGQTIQESDVNSPILGRIRGLNPYDTEAQQVQAQTNAIRQIIGKALEGGVLRKEDEAKYKKILPTLADSQDVALYKIDNLKQLLASDLSNYVKLQSAYGSGQNTGITVADLQGAL